MRPPYTAEEIHAIYMDHLEGCDQCNYDKDCRLCAGGFGRDEPTGAALVQAHSCNCPWGTGLGATLARLDRTFKVQAEVKALQGNLNGIQGNITMLGAYLGWVKIDG